ncbi:MAG TPA: hypothetical protein VMB81_01185 [Candidatus Sulfotelmatobacter sp.]|nr:hypothetical protein [Candidatus Sulfotelmatobacter sp.]
MTRMAMVVAGWLLAGGPALVAAGAYDGTYKGAYEYVAGDLAFCYGDPRPVVTVTVHGTSARGVLVWGLAHLRVGYGNGELALDGSLKLVFTTAPDLYNVGPSTLEGSFADGAFVGFVENRRCRSKLTLTRN